MSTAAIKLRAVNPERNVDRDYEIRVDRALFDTWSVTTAYGRHGKRGVIKDYLFDTEQEAETFSQRTLRKRLNAKARIGCDYVVQSSE